MLGIVPKKTHKTLRIIIALGRGQEKPRIIDEKRTFFLSSDFFFSWYHFDFLSGANITLKHYTRRVRTTN